MNSLEMVRHLWAQDPGHALHYLCLVAYVVYLFLMYVVLFRSCAAFAKVRCNRRIRHDNGSDCAKTAKANDVERGEDEGINLQELKDNNA